MLLPKVFKTANWGDERNGVLSIPEDRTKKYPLEMYFPGLGMPASGLTGEGPLKKFTRTDVKARWLTLAMSGDNKQGGWPPTAQQYLYVAQNDPDIKSLWDGKTILWIGLSAGGQRVLEAIRDRMSGKFIPMAPIGIDMKSVDFNIKREAWFIHSSNDENKNTPYSVSKDFMSAMNSVYPGSARLTTTLTGHGGFEPLLEFDYKDPTYQQSLYDWWLGAAVPVTDPIINPPAQKVVYHTLTLKSGKKLTIFDDDSTELT